MKRQSRRSSGGWAQRLVALGLGALGLAFAGLGTLQAQDKITLNIVVSSWTLPELRDFVKQTYEADHPNVTLNWQALPFAQVLESVEVRMAAKSPQVDVMGIDIPMVASYGIRGYALPLNEYFTEEEQSRWLPEAKQAAYYRGQLLAPPGLTSTQMLYFNRQLFQEAGIEPPSADPSKRWTWKQVAEAAQKLTRDTNNDGKTDVWGFTFDQVNRAYQLLPLPESAGGGGGFGPDGLSVQGRLTNPGWTRAMRFYYDLSNTWKVFPKGVTTQETPDLFRAGKAAMILTGDWGLAWFKNVNFKWGVAPHPYFDGGTAVTPTGAWHWGVSPYSRQRAEAVKFIRFISLDKRVLSFLFEKTSRLPAHRQIFDYTPAQIAALGFPQEAYDLIKYELKNTARHRPQSPGYLEWENLLRTTFEDIRNGANPEEAMKAAEGRIQSQLQKYRP